MSSPADVLDGYFTQLYPGTSYVVEIDPTPVGVQDITFVLTVVDSDGNTTTSSSVVPAGALAPLSGSITPSLSGPVGGVNVIDTYQVNGVANPNGGALYVLVLTNLGLDVQASGGATPYEAELSFNHNTNQPVQYIDYNASTPNPNQSGPSWNNLVLVNFPQTLSYSVPCPGVTNISNT